MSPLANGEARARSLLENLARLTWGWLRDARRLELGFSEDTISDLAMLEIARHASTRVTVTRVSKREERQVGFDWQWEIQRAGLPIMTYVVQAKKMKLDRSEAYSYGRLRYRAGEGKYQIDALEDYAARIGAVPLYCFYNNVDHQTAAEHWNCRVEQPPDLLQVGCTLAPLGVVRPIHDARGQKNFRSMHESAATLPWRCLFHPACKDVLLRDGSNGQSKIDIVPNGTPVRPLTSEFAPRDGSLIEQTDFVRQLRVSDLVDRYATSGFVPLPERIVAIRLDE